MFIAVLILILLACVANTFSEGTCILEERPALERRLVLLQRVRLLEASLLEVIRREVRIDDALEEGGHGLLAHLAQP